MSILNRIGLASGRFLFTLTKPPIPRRILRLIFISSIMGIINEIKDPDQAIVKKLNKLLKIGYDQAWALPMHVKSLIWNHLESSVIPIPGGSIALVDLKRIELNSEDRKVVSD